MNPGGAIDFIRPAVAETTGRWADFGAGSGTFTDALATILDANSRVIAIERDARALRALERLSDGRTSGAAIDVAAGDFTDIDAIPELADIALDGALFANSLHYVRDPSQVLLRVAGLLRPGGRIVVIEYDRARANRWVPYPLPPDRLDDVARRARLARVTLVARRPSAYQGAMYCAVLEA